MFPIRRVIKGLGFTCPGNYRSVAGDKYEAISTKSGYNQYMLLKIRNVSSKDFGSYKCVAQNSLGGTDGVIKLDGEFQASIKTFYFSTEIHQIIFQIVT